MKIHVQTVKVTFPGGQVELPELELELDKDELALVAKAVIDALLAKVTPITGAAATLNAAAGALGMGGHEP